MKKRLFLNEKSSNENEPRIIMLQRALKYLNNGENVYFLNYEYRKKGVILPEIIYINSAFDSDEKGFVTVALFNGDETDKNVSFKPCEIGLENGKTSRICMGKQN